MDISSLSRAYLSQMTDEASAVHANRIKDLAKKDMTAASDDELMEACKKFESYLLEQVFQAMEKTTKLFSDEEEGGNSATVNYFMDATLQKLAETSTEKQGLGLAQSLYESMKRNYSL